MNDSMEVSNKIITSAVLEEIFEAMNDKLESQMRISREEERKNMTLDYSYQSYRFIDGGSSFTFTVYFYDDTSIKYDNYLNFITMFRNRIDEIKSIYLKLKLDYKSRNQGSSIEHHNQTIGMDIHDYKARMEFKFESSNPLLQDVYELIKNKIQESPVKYDDLIKNKSTITSIIALSKGFIPACILILIFFFVVPSIRPLITETYIVFPIAVIMLTFMLGNTLFSASIKELYKTISPKLEYAGYSNRSGSKYKENIEEYTNRSEILIGKNTDNLKLRQTIQEKYDAQLKLIPYELGTLLILSIVVLFF